MRPLTHERQFQDSYPKGSSTVIGSTRVRARRTSTDLPWRLMKGRLPPADASLFQNGERPPGDQPRRARRGSPGGVRLTRAAVRAFPKEGSHGDLLAQRAVFIGLLSGPRLGVSCNFGRRGFGSVLRPAQPITLLPFRWWGFLSWRLLVLPWGFGAVLRPAQPITTLLGRPSPERQLGRIGFGLAARLLGSLSPARPSSAALTGGSRVFRGVLDCVLGGRNLRDFGHERSPLLRDCWIGCRPRVLLSRASGYPEGCGVVVCCIASLTFLSVTFTRAPTYQTKASRTTLRFNGTRRFTVASCNSRSTPAWNL